MTDLPTNLADEDVARLRDLRVAIALATANAERASAELRASQLERQSFIQHLFLQYGLKLSDQIDEQTGIIRHPEQEAQEAQEATQEGEPDNGDATE